MAANGVAQAARTVKTAPRSGEKARGIADIPPAALTLRYFCAYSVHCVWMNYTRGAAPGFILLHKTGYALAIRASSWRSAFTVFALSARTDCESIPTTSEVPAENSIVTAGNEKTDLYVSNDGSQRAKDDSQYRNGRPLRLTGLSPLPLGRAPPPHFLPFYFFIFLLFYQSRSPQFL